MDRYFTIETENFKMNTSIGWMGFVPIEILTNLKLNLLNEKKITIVWYCRQSKDYGLKDYHGIKTTFELTPQKSSSEKNYGNFTNYPNSGTPPFFLFSSS